MAEANNPASNPKLTGAARAIGNAKIPLLWVPGNDPKKAERAFLTINQSAVEIDPTEFTILNSRAKPHAIASRAIVRNAGGHKYWKDFSLGGQREVEKLAKVVYSALYSPPLDPPVRTADLPIAGHGYGNQTLPLIFDFVKIANGIAVVDSSKNKQNKLDVVDQEQPDEEKTIECLKRALRLTYRITGTNMSSLGLHPAVYFYGTNGRHQPTSVLAIAALLIEMENSNSFASFTKVRGVFEQFLVEHKMFVNQLTTKHGSMAKGFKPMKDYYGFVLDQFTLGHTPTEVETALAAHEKHHTLVKERPVLSKKAKRFSQAAKQVTVMNEVLASASVCQLCDARIDLKAIHIDHIRNRRDGGLATTDNARPLHPYCDSTYKDLLDFERRTRVTEEETK